LCVLECDFSLFYVLEYSRDDRVSHTHGTVSWLPGFYNTHTHTHTTYCDARTHMHTITCTHTHTHTHKDKHMHINTYKRTLTHAHTKKIHTLATLPVNKARYARQLVGKQTDHQITPAGGAA